MNIGKWHKAEPAPLTIGFLFNHDQIHQIAHSLPVAHALATRLPHARVSLAVTNNRIEHEVKRLLGSKFASNLEVKKLGIHTASSRLLAGALGRLVPAAKLLLYRDNIAYFSTLDALVVTERTSLILKQHFGLTSLKMILVDHGAGDRAIGFGTSTARFDHILASGAKIRDRLIADAGVTPDKIKIVGYPKFDAAKADREKLPFQCNGNPTIIYNPHLSPHLSSWFKHGRKILDWFITNPQYNLIFAPHVMLFQRRVVFTVDKFRVAFPGKLDKKYLEAPNIHIDLGSVASTDMTYTNAADIYLGDVSSQIYEFLRCSRPAIFIDSQGTDFKDDPNYAHWRAGEVIRTVDQLGLALDRADALHRAMYIAAQKTLFDYTFELTSESSSHRAARAIAEIIGHG